MRGEARPAETKLAPSTKAVSRASGSASVPSSSCFRTGKDPWIAGGRSELSCGCNMLEYAAAERRESSGAAAPVGPAHSASKTRVNALMTRQARRLARRLASHDAGRSPLGAPPWRFWAPGAALAPPSAPAVLQLRAFAFRIRAASSSHPGRSAWRAGSLPPGANGYEPPPQDATPRSAFRIVSRTRPQ